MPSKWLNSLKEEESKHNTAAALRESQNRRAARPDETSKTPITPTDETDKTPRVNLPTPITRPDKTDKTTFEERLREKRRIFMESVRVATDKTSKTPEAPSEAEQLGLVATWSVEFGHVSLHDPASGEWYDLPTKEAPSWAVSEARKRKELYRAGNRKSYRLTSQEMEEIWETERPVEDEGIVEEHPVEEE